MKKLVLLFTLLLFMGFTQLGWGQITYTSTATGIWSTQIWSPAGTPGTSDNIIIADGHTVTIDQAVTVASITVGQGTSGTLIFNSVAHAVTVNGNVTVATGGKFVTGLRTTGDLTITSTTIANVASTVGVVIGMTITGTGIPVATTVAAFDATSITLSAAATATGTGVTLTIGGAVATNTLSIAGDITNNGTFDMSLGGSTMICNVTFTKAGDQTIGTTGSPTTTRFRTITLTKTSLTNRVVSSIDVSYASALTLTAGTWEQTAGNLTCTSTNQTHSSATGALIFSGSGGYISTSQSLIVAGSALTINTSGTVVVGLLANSNNNFQITSGSLTIQKGTINIYGYFKNSGGTINISESGGAGTTNINIKNLSAANNSFDVPSTSSPNFSMSGGTVTIIDPLASGTASKVDVNMSTTATNNITGGTIVIGDGISTNTGTAPGTKGFFINTHTVPLWNLVINAGSTAGRQVTLGDNAATVAPRNLVVKNNLTITSGTLNANAATTGSNITIGGAFTNSGTFNGGTTSVYTFNGSSAQTTGALPGSVPALTINNAAGVTLSGATTVSATLTLTSGNLTTTAANLLTLGSSASVTGGSSSSFIDGPTAQTIATTLSTAKTFPLGKGTAYRPVTLTVTQDAATSTTYTAEVFNAAPTARTLAATHDKVSTVRYWNLAKGAGAGVSSASIQIAYDTDDGVSVAADLRLAKDDGAGTWVDLGGTGTVNTTGTITSVTNFTSFSDFVLANVNLGGNALPVELTSFSASVQNKTVNLVWQTAIEVNNYGFEVEKGNRYEAIGNSAWEKVGFVKGNGNSNSPKEYSFTDKSATAGKYFYRLKQLDNDGQYTYSQEVEVDLGTPTVFALEQNYPNPFNPTTSMQYSVSSKQFVTIKVFDMLGREVAVLVNGEKEPGTYTAEFATTGLASGTYIYRMQAGEFVQTKKMVILK